MNYTPFQVTLFALKDNARKIHSIKSILMVARALRADIGLKEAKLAVEHVASGGVLTIEVPAHLEHLSGLIRHSLSSEFQTQDAERYERDLGSFERLPTAIGVYPEDVPESDDIPF